MESKFNSLSEWRKGEPIGYDMVKKFKMFPEICTLFGWKYTKNLKRHL